MTEHNCFDVQRRETLHGTSRHGDVVAVEAARERHATEAALEGVAHEQDAGRAAPKKHTLPGV